MFERDNFTKLGPGPNNADQPFPDLSALDDVRKGSKSNGGAYGTRPALSLTNRYDHTLLWRGKSIHFS